MSTLVNQNHMELVNTKGILMNLKSIITKRW